MHNVTFSEARATARKLGYVIRRAAPGDSELVVYKLGAGPNATGAYFTDCPYDALSTAQAMAKPTPRPVGVYGGFPLWVAGAARRPAAALLRDIEDATAAAARFNKGESHG
jgi:hypothetical protein